MGLEKKIGGKGIENIALQLEVLRFVKETQREQKKMLRQALKPMRDSVKRQAPLGDGGPDGKHMRDTVHYAFEETGYEISAAVQLGWPDRILEDGWMITGHKPDKKRIRYQPGEKFFKRAVVMTEREVVKRLHKALENYWSQKSSARR